MFEGNALLELADRLRAVFVGRNEILSSTGALLQMQNVYIYQCSATVNMTNAYQDITGATTGAFTPIVNEYAIVQAVGVFNYFNGTAGCNINDTLNVTIDLNYSATAHDQTNVGQVGSANNNGGGAASQWYKLALTAGTAYTIKLRMKNNNGNRGRAETGSQLIVWRVPR